MSKFDAQLQDRIEDQIDNEFIEKGLRLGFAPISAQELRDDYQERDMAKDGDETPSPFAALPRGDRSKAMRARQIGQRRSTPAPKVEEPKPKAKRKQITVQYGEEPIDLIDSRTGDTITVYMRSVPTTELPFLDRHDMMLQRLRNQLSQLTGRDPKTERRVKQLAQEYNEISEEMTRFVIDMPDGLYETLNVPTLRALQREIQNMVTGTSVESPSDDDDETDPNW